MPRIPTSSTATKQLEFVGGTSDKFWEVIVANAEVTVRFGRNGANGQTTTKSFADADKARQFANKAIAEKTRKGYLEVR